MTAAALLAVPTAAIPSASLNAAQTPAAQEWNIGPVIRGRNHSVGMPLNPLPSRRGPYFDFPYPNVNAGHVHYVTFRHGPLSGKRRIVMRYRIDAAPGVRFVARENAQLPATISLYFQRRGDSWSSKRGHEAYRWYAPERTIQRLTPGEHEMVVDLQDRDWISVQVSTPATKPREFAEAVYQTDQVGFVLGARAGRGHGVFATGPARLTILSFRVL
jgi:hypothetical protein